MFVRAFKRQGRFVIPAETVVTSGRKPRTHSFITYAKLSMRVILLGSRGFGAAGDWSFGMSPEGRKRNEHRRCGLNYDCTPGKIH